MGVSAVAIADGFLPDTISTDVFKRHRGWTPPHDLPLTISRLMVTGMSEAEVLGMAGEIGTLAAGACADLAVLRWDPEPMPLADSPGGVLNGPRLEPVVTVRAGSVIKL
jgi:predicted amidohydrolase